MHRIAGTILLFLNSGAAQTASPQFEVASIKPAPPPGTGRMRIGSRGGPGTEDPSLFTCENCGLNGLIFQAFGIKDYQLSAADWMQSARFNVSAKIPEGTTKDQFHMMMRNLLIDRFKLKFHYEKKQMQAYDLVVAKNGPKLKESEGSPDPDESLKREPGGPKIDAEGFPILPHGRVPMAIMLGSGHVATRHVEETMERLAATLSAQVHHPVSDVTGLSGKYDFTLNYIADSAAPSTTDDTGPNIFTALQEQLGLKLESKKNIVDVLVIDHIEKTPTEN
jgi:uncharacterized protein (TIGR03435 family)